MDQKTQFIADYLREIYDLSGLCSQYGISRKTAYKWIERYLKMGAAGLQESSRRPRVSPNATAEPIVQALVMLRRRHPDWGGKKLLKILAGRHPDWELPCRSTVCDILARHDLVRRKRRRRVIGHPGKPLTVVNSANELWCADFKGQFRTGDGLYCYPLTVTDDYSRYLLLCHGLLSPNLVDTKEAFTRLFKEYGLPLAIRTDNGAPFAANSLGRLSQLSAWWVRLGIRPEFIEPGKPQQNGRHERMHRTLKASCTRPPGATRRAQQRKLNAFREEFNNERPHEALDMDTPASWYAPSSRTMPDKLLPFEYPDRFEVRYVSANGGIRWNHHWVNVSISCIGEYVGLEEIDDGIWNVYFGPHKLGRFHERKMRIEDAYGRLNRIKTD